MSTDIARITAAYQVNVAVDQTRQDRVAGGIDDLIAGMDSRLGFWRYEAEAVLVDQDHNISPRRVTSTVDQASCVDSERHIRPLLCGSLECLDAEIQFASAVRIPIHLISQQSHYQPYVSTAPNS